MKVSVGARLGPYEITGRLGAGGMGEVFRANDTRLDRSVAIKVLPAEFAADAQLRARFEGEARATSQLNHPNICTLHDVGDGYIVMELLEGETLAERIGRGRMPIAKPAWRQDGKAIYFVDLSSRINESVITLTPTFTAQQPQPLFPIRRREGAGVIAQYDVASDGTFIVNAIPDTATSSMTLVVNWRDALAK